MNVIFLTIDALRADRCSVNGYKHPTTPTLEKLAARGVNCTQAVSPGAFTHICFPSLMTSSRPLSYGGYDTGAVGRPQTILKTARDAGHHVTAFCTTHWVCRYHGYGEGIDDEHLMFVLNTLPGTALALFRSTLALWHRGEISDAEVTAAAERTVGVFFENMLDYCHEQMSRRDENQRFFGAERFVIDGYDYPKVIALVEEHRSAFHADNLGYLKQHMPFVPKAHEWIGHEWRFKRNPGALLRLAAGSVVERLADRFGWGDGKFARYREKRYVDGGAVADQIVSQIETWDGERPFFIWNHFQDTHVPYCAGRGRDWFHQTPEYLRRLGHPDDIDVTTAVGPKPDTPEKWQAWSMLYDAAILYVDDQIACIVDALEHKGILDDTLIVVCGDHGEELGEHGDMSHHFRLYSHNVRVPLIFSHPDVPAGDVDALVELMDVAPTIAACADMNAPADWIGAPVWSDTVRERNSIVVESFFGGNCEFEARPLYMAARDHRWNFMWKERLDPEDHLSPAGHQLYDVAADPDERDNLYTPEHPEVPRLARAIAERLGEIDEIPLARVDAGLCELIKNKEQTS